LARAALIVLLQALVIALVELGVPAGWASLIVGVLVAGAAYAFIQKGVNDLKAGRLAPHRTMDAMRKDAAALKEQVQ
jgi:hypothetical protein